MTLTNFPNGISSFGVPLPSGSIPVTTGNYYYVNPTTGSDYYDGKSPDKPFATVLAAYNACTTNNDDVIVLSGYAAHSITALLAVSKSRIHFVGIGQPSLTGLQGTRLVMPAATAVQSLMRNTGTRNSFTNIKFVNESTQSAAKYCVEEGGEGTTYVGCAIQMNAKLSTAATSDLLIGGDSVTFSNCTIGNDNLLTSTNRAGVLIDPVTGGAECMKNCLFDKCIFQMQSSDNTALLVKVNATSSLKFGNLFRDCIFLSIINGTNVAVALTNAVSSIASLVEGNVLFTNPATNCTNFSASSSVNFKVTGTPTVTTNAFEGVTPA